MKREHLAVMPRQRLAILLVDGRLGKPFGAFVVLAEMEALSCRRIIGEHEAEDQYGDEFIAVQGMNARIDQQNRGKGQHMPEALLGENRQEIGPQNAYENARGNSKNEARKETPSDDSWRGAAAGSDAKERGDGQNGEGVAKGGFDKERDLNFAAEIHLLKNGQNNRAADAAEGSSDQERGNPGEMKNVAADKRNADRAEQVTQGGKKKAASEVVENFAELEFEAAFEKDKNKREDRKSTRLNSSHSQISYAV